MTGQYSGELITPKEHVKELICHSPEIHLLYNIDDKLIKIRKLTSDGEIFERQVTDPDIDNYVTDRIVIYSSWGKVRGQ